MTDTQQALQVVLWKSYLGLSSFASRYRDKDSRSRGLFRRLSQNPQVEEWEAQVWWAFLGTAQVPSGRKAMSVTRRALAFSSPWRLSWLKKTTSPIVRPSTWRSPCPVTNCKVKNIQPTRPNLGKVWRSILAPELQRSQLRPLFGLHCSPTFPSATQLLFLPFHKVVPRRTS